MTTKIYKYAPDDVPLYAHIVHFGYDPKEGFRVWAEVSVEDVGSTTLTQLTVVIPTGGVVPKALEYFGTAITPSGFVYHLYC